MALHRWLSRCSSEWHNAVAELPSAFMSWLLIAKINRRSSVVAFSAAASACSLVCVAIPRRARMAAELLSFFATCTAYNVVLVYSMELFSTSVRSSAVGLVRQAMVLGGVAAPVLVALGRERAFLSFGVFGLVIGCSGLFAACLPETRGGSMLDTVEEGDANVAPVTDTTAPSKNSDSDLCLKSILTARVHRSISLSEAQEMISKRLSV
ncbi:hypothetical protein EJB05_18153, partial [Eragrostis curvula]